MASPDSRKSGMLAQTILILGLVLFGFYSVIRVVNRIVFDMSKQWVPRHLFLNSQSNLIAGIALVSIAITFFVLYKMGKAKYMLVICPLLVIISGKGTALVALIIYVLACVGLGVAFLNFFENYLGWNNKNNFNIFAFGLAVFIGGAINGYVTWVALHFKINYMLTYYLFFIVEIVIFRKYIIKHISILIDKIKSKQFSSGQILILGSAVFYLFYSLVPFYMYDDVVKHLMVPHLVYLHGFFNFDPSFVLSLDSSIFPQSAYTSTFLMGGEYAVRLLNFAIFILAFLLVEDYARTSFGNRVAFLASITIITTPFVLWQIGVVFIDSFAFVSSVILFILFFKAIEDFSKNNILLYFLVVGFSFLCKQQAVFIIIPTALVLFFFCLKRALSVKSITSILHFLLGCFIPLVLLIPVLVHNYIISGNPLFPFYNGIFKSEWFYPGNFIDHRWQQPLKFNSIYDLTFHGSKYIENIDLSFGITFFVFFIFSVLLFTSHDNRKKAGILFLLFLSSCLLWFKITGPYMRYFISIIFIGALLIGLTIDRILKSFSNRFYYKFALGIIFLVFGMNLFVQLNIQHIYPQYPLIEGLLSRRENRNLQYTLGLKKIFDYASLKYGNDSKGLLVSVDPPVLYFADFKVETLLWYHYKNQKEILESSNSAEDMYNNIFKKKKFNFIIMPNKTDNPIFDSPEFRHMVNNEFSVGSFGLYVPQKLSLSTTAQ